MKLGPGILIYKSWCFWLDYEAFLSLMQFSQKECIMEQEYFERKKLKFNHN